MRKKFEHSLGLYMTPDEWDFITGQLKNKSKNMQIHKIMIEFESEVLRILDDRQSRGLPVSARIIKRIIDQEMAIDSSEGAVYMLLPFLQSTIERMQKNKSEYTPGTIQHYITLIGHMKEFLSTKNLNDQPLHLIDSAFLQEFDDHMVTWLHPKLGRSMNRNTANKYHSKFRAVLHDANRRKLITSNPYESMKLKRVVPVSDFLTDIEIEQILKKKYDNQSLETVVAYLIFSVFAGGIRFSDESRLHNHNLIVEDGHHFIQLANQKKTNNSVLTPLLPPAVAILNKYKSVQEETGYLLPRLSQQKLNEYLKTIGDVAGVHKKMTHKIARHTFGTIICSRNGVPRHITAAWMGHVLPARSTDVYAHLTKGESLFWLEKLWTIYNKPQFFMQ